MLTRALEVTKLAQGVGMAKGLKERKAEIAARRQALQNIFPGFEELDEDDTTWKGHISDAFLKHEYVVNAKKTDQAWFWSSESTERNEADQDLFIAFLLDINDELTSLLNEDSSNQELYDTKCRLYLKLWKEVNAQRPNETPLDYRQRLLDFNAVLDDAAQFSNIKTHKTFVLIKHSVYNALWQMESTQQDSSFLRTMCALFPDQKDEALYNKLWDLEQSAPPDETPAVKKARLIGLNAFLTKEVTQLTAAYCQHMAARSKNENEVRFLPLKTILDIKEEIYKQMGYPKVGSAITFELLKNYYRDTCNSDVSSNFGRTAALAKARDENLVDALKYYDNMVEKNQIESEPSMLDGALTNAVAAFPRVTISDKEEIKIRMAARLVLLNDLKTLFPKIKQNTFDVMLGKIDVYNSKISERHGYLDSLAAMKTNATVDSEDKNEYQIILATLMRGLVDQVSNISTLDQQAALITALELLWPAIQERWIKPNGTLENEDEQAGRMLSFSRLLQQSAVQIVNVSDSREHINRILALKKNVGQYAQSTGNNKAVLSYDQEYRALSERITLAWQPDSSPTLLQVRAMIASCQSLWPMQSVQLPNESKADFRKRLIAFNKCLTDCSLLILKLDRQDQHELDIQNIFVLKQDLRRAFQPFHGVIFTQAIAQNFDELQRYCIKRFNDKREFYGWLNWGYTRTEKLTAAMRCYDDVIEFGSIQESSRKGAASSTWFNTLGTIINKLFTSLTTLRTLFKPRGKVEVTQDKQSPRAFLPKTPSSSTGSSVHFMHSAPPSAPNNTPTKPSRVSSGSRHHHNNPK